MGKQYNQISTINSSICLEIPWNSLIVKSNSPNCTLSVLQEPYYSYYTRALAKGPPRAQNTPWDGRNCSNSLESAPNTAAATVSFVAHSGGHRRARGRPLEHRGALGNNLAGKTVRNPRGNRAQRYRSAAQGPRGESALGSALEAQRSAKKRVNRPQWSGARRAAQGGIGGPVGVDGECIPCPGPPRCSRGRVMSSFMWIVRGFGDIWWKSSGINEIMRWIDENKCKMRVNWDFAPEGE